MHMSAEILLLRYTSGVTSSKTWRVHKARKIRPYKRSISPQQGFPERRQTKFAGIHVRDRGDVLDMHALRLAHGGKYVRNTVFGRDVQGARLKVAGGHFEEPVMGVVYQLGKGTTGTNDGTCSIGRFPCCPIQTFIIVSISHLRHSSNINP